MQWPGGMGGMSSILGSPPSPPSDSAQANTTTDFEHSEQGPSANERVSELETSQ